MSRTQINPFDENLTAYRAAKYGSNREVALFHFYNPNGIMAEWKKLGDRLVKFGRGYLAYGDTGFYYTEMMRLARAKAVRSHDLHALLQCIRMTIDLGNAFLAENGVED